VVLFTENSSEPYHPEDSIAVLRNTPGTLPLLTTECHDLDSMVVDVGCNAGVGGSIWCEAAEQKHGQFEREIKPTSFTFGAGETVATSEVVVVPILLGNTHAKVRMHIVPGPLPPLLSRPSMAKMGMVISLKDDSISGNIDGEHFSSPLHLSSSGHYLIRIVTSPTAIP
jgi:hypothetical protein